MATAKRTTTGRAASAKTGAASAVPKDKALTIEADEPIVVDSTTDGKSTMERAEAEADAEDARQEAEARASAADAEAALADTTRVEETPTGSTIPANEPPKLTQGVYGPDGTTEYPVVARDLTDAPAPAAELADPTADDAPRRDLAALHAIADPSGLEPATPYTDAAVPAPTPVKPLPPVRRTQNWAREEDTTAVARVLVDGFRISVNGAYRFAQKGDLITAPIDVINRGAERGVLHKEG